MCLAKVAEADVDAPTATTSLSKLEQGLDELRYMHDGQEIARLAQKLGVACSEPVITAKMRDANTLGLKRASNSFVFYDLMCLHTGLYVLLLLFGGSARC
jgi:hypothetical protein